jgi:hypothetical protein
VAGRGWAGQGLAWSGALTKEVHMKDGNHGIIDTLFALGFLGIVVLLVLLIAEMGMGILIF